MSLDRHGLLPALNPFHADTHWAMELDPDLSVCSYDMIFEPFAVAAWTPLRRRTRTTPPVEARRDNYAGESGITYRTGWTRPVEQIRVMLCPPCAVEELMTYVRIEQPRSLSQKVIASWTTKRLIRAMKAEPDARCSFD